MQIRLAIPFILLLGIFLIACQEQGNAPNPGLAVVDMTRVMRDSAPGKEGIKFLESRQAALQADLDAIQEKLEKNPSDEASVQELQRVYAVSQQRMQAEQQNVLNILFDAITRIMNDYCVKHGYDVILGTEAAAAFNPKVDVTNAIIAEVDKQKIEFKPLPEARLPQKDNEAAADEAKKALEDEKPVEKPAAKDNDKKAANTGKTETPAKK